MTDNNGQDKKHPKHDPFAGVTGGLILILLGVLFLLASLDYLSWGIWWAYFLFGLGCILILDALLRILFSDQKQGLSGKLIGGTVLIIIGAANIFGMITWWPLILIAVGVVVIVSSLAKSKK
jgi:hypothetical protein